MNVDSLASLRRNFAVEDLVEATGDSDVSQTIVVQARQSLAESESLIDIARRHSLIGGVVGWLALCAPDARSAIELLASDPKFKGVRHVIQDEPDDLFILRDDFNRGVSLLKDFDLVYDILIYDRHLPQSIEFVDRHPRQVFVLDHIAKPRIKENSISLWAERIRELAKRENVFCKVSGMVTEADWRAWSVEQLRPYFEVVLDAFGPRRLMFGSDWPVLTLASDYGKWVSAFKSFIAGLSADERERISSGTAKEVYRL
jgi:L-fuconolactonase